jgi:hypothetical protein
MDTFLEIEGDVKNILGHFCKDALSDSFGHFLFSLKVYARTTNTRIWIIVDEVVLFENFPIDLPEEQNL